MSDDRAILVLGAGSVGKRHLRNFVSLDSRVAAVDPRESRLDEARDEVTLVGGFSSLEQALETPGEFRACVVASPTAFHVEQAKAALAAGLPVLMEKPLCMDEPEAHELVAEVERSGLSLLLGYTYRWWPALQQLRSSIQSGMIGRPVSARFTMSAHLADWHPWEPYQDWFMASRELGGGALLDESHFVDLMLWFFGHPIEVFARVERISDLEIESDDNVDAWFCFQEDLRVRIHLDLYGRPHERAIQITGSEGKLTWNYDDNAVRRSSDPTGREWEETPFGEERNHMFVSVAKEFLGILTGDEPSCTVHDGLRVMRVLDAMRESSRSGRSISLEP